MRALILGGTGTLGKELTRQLLEKNHEVTCFSRSELNQKQMEAEFKRDPRLHFIIGDIRDPAALDRAFRGIDTVFHVAALKHIDTLELNPEESVKTNVLGTINVADAAERAGVRHVIFSSTDKAVAPVNVYGMSKGISEKILLHRNKTQKTTHYAVFRWGNILGSRGSIIPIFATTLKNDKKAYLTHQEMTRFWLRIEDAVSFMLREYMTAECVMIPTAKSASVARVIDATARVLGVVGYQVECVGMRPGEKIHEALTPEMTSDKWVTYTDQELEGLIRPIIGAGV